MACFSLFKALYTHRNDSTPLPSFLSAPQPAWRTTTWFMGDKGGSGVERKGDGMGDLQTTADKQQGGGGKQTLVPSLVLLWKRVCQPRSVCMAQHWFSAFTLYRYNLLHFIQKCSDKSGVFWCESYLPTGPSRTTIGGLSPWESGQGQRRDNRLTRGGEMSRGRTSCKGKKKMIQNKHPATFTENRGKAFDYCTDWKQTKCLCIKKVRLLLCCLCTLFKS